MGGGDAVPAEDLGDEATLLLRAIVNGDLAAFYCSYIIPVSRFSSSTGAEYS